MPRYYQELVRLVVPLGGLQPRLYLANVPLHWVAMRMRGLCTADSMVATMRAIVSAEEAVVSQTLLHSHHTGSAGRCSLVRTHGRCG